MSEPQDARDLLSRAERAAAGGDLASADQLLRAAARIQEAQLGPHHSDLANTLNNLAVVAEKAGQLDEAERCYRRAVSIAAASLPADDPMVMASRENLEDFCRAHDLPLERKQSEAPPVVPAPRESELPPAAPVARPAASIAAAPIPAAPRSRPPLAAEPLPPVPARDSAARSAIWIATAAAVFLVLLLLVWRPWSQDGESPPPPADAAATPETAAPSTAPADSSPPPAPASGRSEPDVATSRKRAPSAPPGDISVIAQLCRDFSARGSRWRCTVAGNPVAPGPMVLYTRVKSPRNAAVIHRWYRGSALRQSVTLSVRANATDGYRTYSRQTVSPGEWRVEVATADGRLLDEQRFIVK